MNYFQKRNMHLTWLPVVNILSRLLAPLPTPNPHYHFRKKKSSLHLFQLLTIDNDTQQRPKMWYHEVSGTKFKKKLNVVLSCAYLLKVVL